MKKEGGDGPKEVMTNFVADYDSLLHKAVIEL